MAKGKRELRIESDVFDGTYKEFMTFIERKIKEAGVKYNDDAKLYFNVNNKTVYVVTDKTNFEVKLWN